MDYIQLVQSSETRSRAFIYMPASSKLIFGAGSCSVARLSLGLKSNHQPARRPMLAESHMKAADSNV